MDTEKILEKIESVVTPVVSSLGYELIERELIMGGGSCILRLYIDNTEGKVTISDCSNVSRAVESVLDVEDLIHYPYSLEVSSPGLDRPLRKKEDFVRFKDRIARIKTKTPIDGRSNYKGILQGLDNEDILIEVDNEIYRVHYLNVAKARLEPQF